MFGTFCYKYASTPKTESGATNDCNGQGAHIASIHSAEENAFVQKLGESTHSKWLGARKKGGSFQWLDGTAFNFKKWNPGMPDNYAGVESCIEIQTNKGWNDISCNSERRYVCKKPLPGIFSFIALSQFYQFFYQYSLKNP